MADSLQAETWKLAMKQGIVDVCRELPGSNPAKVTCGRAANHSNFPECTTCSERRNRWLSAVKKPDSDPAMVQASRASPRRTPPTTITRHSHLFKLTRGCTPDDDTPAQGPNRQWDSRPTGAEPLAGDLRLWSPGCLGGEL